LPVDPLFTAFACKQCFKKDYKKLPKNIQEKVDACLTGMLQNPMPAKLRFEKLVGFKNPNIFSVHVTGNHSHKLSFEINDGIAILRRISTHKKIDRAP